MGFSALMVVCTLLNASKLELRRFFVRRAHAQRRASFRQSSPYFHLLPVSCCLLLFVFSVFSTGACPLIIDFTKTYLALKRSQSASNHHAAYAQSLGAWLQ
jgi:hypothetical protein